MVSQKNSPGDILEVRGKNVTKTLFIFETVHKKKLLYFTCQQSLLPNLFIEVMSQGNVSC